MKHQCKSKSAQKPQTKDEFFDAMIPKRSVDKTAEILEKHKATIAKTDPRTRAVNSVDYGFAEKPLTIFVRPDATREQIIEKFCLRFNKKAESDFRIRQNKRVPKATK